MEAGLLHAPKVEKIENLGDCIIRIHYDGKTKDIDTSSLNLAKRYPKLKNPEYAGKAFFEDGCIKWSDGPWINADELDDIPAAKQDFKNKVASSYNLK
jgi:hypothetical protein